MKDMRSARRCLRQVEVAPYPSHEAKKRIDDWVRDAGRKGPPPCQFDHRSSWGAAACQHRHIWATEGYGAALSKKRAAQMAAQV